MLDEQAEQVLASTDPVAERVRKVGGLTLRSTGDVVRHQSLVDNDEDFVAPPDMLRELVADNKAVAATMREAHGVCEKHEDVGTTALLEELIDQAERRTWFLFETSRKADPSGH
jgi:starvation-inducible DNA-binding protein